MNYYSIYNVGKVISESDFFKQRLQAAAWVHLSEFVEKILNGDYDSIYPLHIELCSTYLCNFNCPWCSCRKSRMRKDNKKNSLNFQEIRKILDECKSNNIGIQWTGGEPLLNCSTIEGIVYGSKIGISQCLFTNGSLINESIDNDLLLSNLEFIRVSLNSVSPSFHSLFHGNISYDLSKTVLINVERLCKIKRIVNSNVKIGISVVVDSNNIDDLLNTIDYIERLSLTYPNSINYVIIRAVNDDFDGIKTKKDDDFSIKYYTIVNRINIIRFRKNGVEIILPNDIKCECNLTNIYQRGCSVFSEIAPDGSMFLCSDKYGNKDFSIGNVLSQSITDIWASSKKKEIQNSHSDCLASGGCPHYSRGWYFNSIFSQIEELKKTGNINVVKDWILNLQNTVPKCNHSFFI